MIELIKILSAFAFFFFTSVVFGYSLAKKLKIDFFSKYYAPLGTLSFIAIYQLLIYPVQLLSFQSKWLVIAFVLECVAVYCFSFRNIVSCLKECVKECIYTIFFCAFMFVIYALNSKMLGVTYSFDDINFYIRMIMANSGYTNPVNGIEPYTFYHSNIGTYYAFSGMFHLYSAIATLFQVRPYRFLIWFGSILTSAIIFETSMAIIKRYKNRTVTFIVVLLLLTYSIDPKSLSNACLPSYFRNYSFAFFLWTQMLIEYYRSERKVYFYLFQFFSIALLACQSSQLFICLMVALISIIFEIVYLHKLDMVHFIMHMMPSLLYAVFFFAYDGKLIVSILLIGSFAAIYLIHKILMAKFDQATVRKIYAALIILIALTLNASVFIIRNDEWTFNSALSLFKDTLIPNSYDLQGLLIVLFIIVCITNLLYRKNNTVLNYISFFTVTAIILFVNPLVAPFVGKYLTGLVYKRVLALIMPIAFLVELLYQFEIENKKTLTALIILLTLTTSISTVTRGINHLKDCVSNGTTDRSLSLYKIDSQIIELGSIFDNTYKKETKILFPLTINNFSYLSNNIVTTEYSMTRQEKWTYMDVDYNDLNKCSDQKKAHAILTKPEYYFTDYFYSFEKDDVFDIKGFLLNSDVEVFIIKRYDDGHLFHDVLNEFSYLIGKTEDYEMYQIIR